MFFADIHVHHVGWRGTHITEYRLLSTRRPHLASHTLSAHSVGRRFARPRIPIFSCLNICRHSGACGSFLTMPDCFNHSRPRHRPRTRSGRVPTAKGAFGIQGRHRSDSDASHSAPSTRQDGAHNLTKQRKTMSDNLDRINARIGGEA